jgi:hypothetical protein
VKDLHLFFGMPKSAKRPNRPQHTHDQEIAVHCSVVLPDMKTLMDNRRDYLFALPFFLLFNLWSVWEALRPRGAFDSRPLLVHIIGWAGLVIIVIYAISLFRTISLSIERWIVGLTIAICLFDVARLLSGYGIPFIPTKLIGYTESMSCVAASILAITRVYDVFTVGTT